MPPKRMTANPIRPARHRPGKPGAAAARESSSEEDEDEDEEPTSPPLPQPATSKPKPPTASSFPKSSTKTLSPHEAKAIEAEFETESEDEGSPDENDEEDSGSEESGSSSEETESSSDDEATRRRLMRPVFIKKTARKEVVDPTSNERQDLQLRQAKKDAMIQDQLEKNARAIAEAKLDWDDETNIEDVDDTDGLDPEAELTAWKLREFKRVKQERDELIAKEKEREEVERRRNLTAEERAAEDREYLDAQKAERDDRGKMGHLQKYFHKGAFYADDMKGSGLDKRDIMGGRYEDDVIDRAALPEYMQIRDMTRLGRKGRTRYKDLKTEDTGRFGEIDGGSRKGKGSFTGLDDRFQPDYDRDIGGATGANASTLGDRKRHREEDHRDGKRPRVD